MMFVLFPVAAIFAFYTPLEGFAAGVVGSYIAIFLKSVVLLTLAAVVIRLFTVAAGNLVSLAAVGLVALLLCGIMAKEALGSLLSSVSFVGSSVNNLGASLGLGGGRTSGSASPESRLAASAIGGPLTQTLIGAPSPSAALGAGPHMPSAGGGLVGMVGGAPGQAMGTMGGSARAAVTAALGAATGGAGFLAGAAAAAKGAGFGSLALGSSAASILGGRRAAQGFTLGASLGSLRRATRGGRPSPTAIAQSAAATTPAAAVPKPASSPRRPGATASQPTASLAGSGSPPAATPLQTIMAGRGADLSAWQPADAQRITDVGTGLRKAPQEVQGSVPDLMQAGYTAAQQWAGEGRSPFQEDGALDPRFTEEVISQVPAAARAFAVGQAKANLPREKQVPLNDVLALGVLSPEMATSASLATPEGEPYDAALFEQLRTWRRDTAAGLGKRAFHVFPDATLQRIAAARPQSEEDLLAVKGVGPKKLAQFGRDVLNITRQGT